MKKIGIIFAMREELDDLLKDVHIERETTVFDVTFYECIINNNRCFLAESGYGKVNSARVTQLLIDKVNPDYILNVGVAGSISKNVFLEDIVVGTKMVCHDFDMTEVNHEKGFIPGIGIYINNSPELIDICKGIKEKNVHYGVIASGDKFIAKVEDGEEISNNYEALCVEMEGASVAQVCYLCAVPCLVIRCISDSIYKGNSKDTLDNLIDDTTKKVCNYLMKFIERIK